MYLFRAYLKFLWRSTNQHGVHSPFVYGLVTRCFYDRKKHPAYALIASYRKNLLQNKVCIEVRDFGAGSRVFKSNKRQISAIAKNAGITPKRARLLNRLVRYLQVNTALELGTSVGISTAAMAAGNEIRITSLEGCPNTAGVAREQFKAFGLGNIELRTGEFDQVTIINDQLAVNNYQLAINNNQLSGRGGQLSGDIDLLTDNSNQFTGNVKFDSLIPNSRDGGSLLDNYDLIFFDGNHQKDATLEYFEALLPRAHNDTVFIFDDIHWSEEMTEAWEEIKSHPAVKVSIDTFQWGLVFFRREQEKEHFVIRV